MGAAAGPAAGGGGLGRARTTAARALGRIPDRRSSSLGMLSGAPQSWCKAGRAACGDSCRCQAVAPVLTSSGHCSQRSLATAEALGAGHGPLPGLAVSRFSVCSLFDLLWWIRGVLNAAIPPVLKPFIFHLRPRNYFQLHFNSKNLQEKSECLYWRLAVSVSVFVLFSEAISLCS